MSDVLAYFLTWTTYGTWLPGDSRGWVNQHRTHGEVVDPPTPRLADYARRLLKEPPIKFDTEMRAVADKAIREACAEFNWTIRALEVRSTHVHVVVTAHDSASGKVMGVLKARTTKAMKSLSPEVNREHWWTKDGSKHLLYNQEALLAAIRYVNHQDTSWVKWL
jgi:REP element-mobilizing transposase RayT